MNANRRSSGQLSCLTIVGAVVVVVLAFTLPTVITPAGIAIAFLALVLGLGLAGLIDACLQVRDAMRDLTRTMTREPARRGLLRSVLAEHAAEEEQAAEARADEVHGSEGQAPETGVKKAGDA